MPETLYHFCSDVHLEAILKQGLTRGVVAWISNGMPRVRTGFQWLTENPERSAQQWCPQHLSSLPYDRCANRLTIRIPLEDQVALSRWVDAGPLMVPEDQLRILNMFGNAKEYWLYRGSIPAEWITQVDRLGARWGEGAGRLVKTPA